MVYAQPRIRPGKWDTQNLKIQTDHLNSTRPCDSQQKINK